MKTVKKWLQELPEPYRAQALENMDSDEANTKVNSQYQALDKAFVWEETPQGEDYWDSIYDKLYNGIPLIPRTTITSTHDLLSEAFSLSQQIKQGYSLFDGIDDNYKKEMIDKSNERIREIVKLLNEKL